MTEKLAIGIMIFYIIPWFALHAWLLYQAITNSNSLGEGRFGLAGLFIFIVAVIPLLNLGLAWGMLVEPAWFRLVYLRREVPLPKTEDYKDKTL